MINPENKFKLPGSNGSLIIEITLKGKYKLYVVQLYSFYIHQPPLWSSGQSSWLQIQRFGFDSRHYQIFWEAVGLEWRPLWLASTIEELLGRNNSGYGIEKPRIRS
jgi:hypothetical protein